MKRTQKRKEEGTKRKGRRGMDRQRVEGKEKGRTNIKSKQTYHGIQLGEAGRIEQEDVIQRLK
eukprot:6192408-Pleurochrysis_carterae.AAC.2